MIEHINDLIITIIGLSLTGIGAMLVYHLKELNDQAKGLQQKVGDLIAEVARIIQRDSHTEKCIEDHETRIRNLERR